MKKESGYWQNSVLCDRLILYSPHSICLNIVFWQSSFVRECYVANHSTFNWKTVLQSFKKFAFFRKFISNLVLKLFKIPSDCHIKACRFLKWRAVLKIPIIKEPMFFLLALKWNLYEKAFSCVKTKTNFWRKTCWNAEKSNHSVLSNWWTAFFKHLYSLIMWQYNI